MLESGIVIAFAATCVVVFAFAAVAFMRAALTVRELAARAKTIVPTSLLLQMRVAGRDAHVASRQAARNLRRWLCALQRQSARSR